MQVRHDDHTNRSSQMKELFENVSLYIMTAFQLPGFKMARLSATGGATQLSTAEYSLPVAGAAHRRTTAMKAVLSRNQYQHYAAE
jgi:hypothetical protein